MSSPEDAEFTPEFPEQGERLSPHHKSAEALTLLARRRSTAAIAMREPGPSPEELDTLLSIAARVPDHGKMAPWRFLLFQGEARLVIGQIIAKIWASENEADEARLALETSRFVRAPLVIGVVSHVLEKHAIPEWEQILSAGAVCQNLLLGAQAMGYASQWLTEWYAYHPLVKDTLGLRSGERIAGFIHIGSTDDEPVERPRPEAQIGVWRG
ncbi:nitroreductase [Hyphobacterium sp. HN65]|uniref:Putative NAD(P)H nitroreductase n=1 Tax=Hyphobacterium lacteum TaxID=3116575 RepID=A0ABU7LTT6_9PROT|nr:nitroreductase [Hyphobacterium sp. HN65]MEE2527265.1 nitroreductase [Hyphobacterium sp. HN65]